MLTPGNPEMSYPLSNPDTPLVRSEVTKLTLPPSSIMLQKVKVGEDWAFAAGDVVITWMVHVSFGTPWVAWGNGPTL